MKRKIIALFSILLIMTVLIIPASQPVYALDQYPKWGRDQSNIIDNQYMQGASPFARLSNIYTTNNNFWSKLVVWNDTGSTWTVRTKSIPATADQIKLVTPRNYVIQGSTGVTGVCYDAATGGQAWGCQLTIPDGGQVTVLAAVYYTGDNTPDWYSTQDYLYNDTYTITIAGLNRLVTLH